MREIRGDEPGWLAWLNRGKWESGRVSGLTVGRVARPDWPSCADSPPVKHRRRQFQHCAALGRPPFLRRQLAGGIENGGFALRCQIHALIRGLSFTVHCGCYFSNHSGCGAIYSTVIPTRNGAP